MNLVENDGICNRFELEFEFEFKFEFEFEVQFGVKNAFLEFGFDFDQVPF